MCHLCFGWRENLAPGVVVRPIDPNDPHREYDLTVVGFEKGFVVVYVLEAGGERHFLREDLERVN